MRQAIASLAHPARLIAFGTLGALALTLVMLAGRPVAPPEAEATIVSILGRFNTQISRSSANPGGLVELRVDWTVSDLKQADHAVQIVFPSNWPLANAQFLGANFDTSEEFVNLDQNLVNIRWEHSVAQGRFNVTWRLSAPPPGRYAGLVLRFLTTEAPEEIPFRLPGTTTEVNFVDFDFPDPEIAASKTVVNDSGSDSGRFNVSVRPIVITFGNPSTTSKVVGDGGVTASVTVPKNTTIIIEETSDSGPPLSEYQTSMTCTGQPRLLGAAQTLSPVKISHGVWHVPGFSGDLRVSCNITNVRQGSITVTKLFSGTATGTVNLQIDGGNRATGVGHGGTTGRIVVDPGIHSVAEIVNTINLADYNASVACSGEAPVSGTSANLTVSSGENVVCNITNTRKTGTITVTKEFSVTAGTVDLQIDGNARATGVGHNGTTGQITVDTGLRTIAEVGNSIVLADYNSTIACSDETPNSSFRTSATVDVSEGENVACTITNTRKTGTIAVTKVFSGTETGTVDLQIDGQDQITNVGASGTTGEITVDTGSHSIGEVANSLIPGDYNATIVCSGETANSSFRTSATVDVIEGESVVCTITNTRKQGTLTLVKQSLPDSAPGRFDLQVRDFDNQRTLVQVLNVGDGGSTSKITLDTGTYLVRELVNSTTNPTERATYIASISCDNNARDAVAPGTELLVTIGEEDVTCTFTNVKQGSLTIVKVAVPNDAADFGFTPSANLGAAFSLDDDAIPALSDTRLFADLPNGADYAVAEDAAGPGWLLIEIACTGAANSTLTFEPSGASTFQPGDTSVTLSLLDGEDVTCTFTNEAQGSLTIVKDTTPDQPTDFAYLATGIDVTDFTLDDAMTDDFDGVPVRREFTLLPDGRVVTVTEVVGAGFELEGIACTGATASTVGIDGALLAVRIELGEDVICTFTNLDTDTATTV